MLILRYIQLQIMHYINNIILYYTIWYDMIWYYMIWYYIILYYMILYYIIWYYTILYHIILYYMISYYIILYYIILCHYVIISDCWYKFLFWKIEILTAKNEENTNWGKGARVWTQFTLMTSNAHSGIILTLSVTSLL